MSTKVDGNAAFPMPASENNREWYGISLRDYFAAGFAASQTIMTSADTSLVNPQYLDPRSHGLTVAQVIAKNSYELADAMLAERGK